MRDFYVPTRHTPVGFLHDDADEKWVEPDEEGGYDAGTLPIIRPKFEKILTIHKENVRALKWLQHKYIRGGCRKFSLMLQSY